MVISVIAYYLARQRVGGLDKQSVVLCQSLAYKRTAFAVSLKCVQIFDVTKMRILQIFRVIVSAILETDLKLTVSCQKHSSRRLF